MYTILCHVAINEGWFEGMLPLERIYVRKSDQIWHKGTQNI
jgi:hypothetical protein